MHAEGGGCYSAGVPLKKSERHGPETSRRKDHQEVANRMSGLMTAKQSQQGCFQKALYQNDKRQTTQQLHGLPPVKW